MGGRGERDEVKREKWYGAADLYMKGRDGGKEREGEIDGE